MKAPQGYEHNPCGAPLREPSILLCCPFMGNRGVLSAFGHFPTAVGKLLGYSHRLQFLFPDAKYYSATFSVTGTRVISCCSPSTPYTVATATAS